MLFIIGVLLGIGMFYAGYLAAREVHRAIRRRSGWEDVDPFEFMRRSEAMAIRHNQITEEAKTASGEKLDALEAESVLILNNIRELRLEQMECQENGWRRQRDEAIGGDPR
jgi:hypothetical protein